MAYFEWFERVPQLSDPLERPVATIPDDILDDDDFDIGQESAALADLIIEIDYTNAGGISTRRTITLLGEVPKAKTPAIYAYCHYRRAFRQFRLDRITSVVTLDGEYFEPPSRFWQSIGYVPGISSSNGSSAPKLSDAGSVIKAQFKHEIVVLAALSASDGDMHEGELDEIIDYIERELEWSQQYLQPIETEALRNHIKHLRITRDRLEASVAALLTTTGKHRLYHRQLDRFIQAARRVTDADGKFHPAEYEFLAALGERLAT